MALSFSGLPQSAHRNTAMGTPQTRRGGMHHAGRVSVMFDMRSSPQDGSHFTFLISSSVRDRRVSLLALCWDARFASGADEASAPTCVSIEMNHCSVARKITGLWQRQQCG